MLPSSVIITREDLYAELWKSTLVNVSTKYGVNPWAIVKICRDQNIPRPCRGYWAKLAAGKKTRKPPLPPKDNAMPIKLGAGAKHANKSLSSLMKAIGNTKKKIKSVPDFSVHEKLENPHPIICKTRKVLKNNDKISFGYPFYNANIQIPFLSLDVSKEQRNRALCILDTLVKALSSLGYSIEPQSPDQLRVGVKIFGMHIDFKIYEMSQFVKNRPKFSRNMPNDDWGKIMEKHLTGKLCFKTNVWCGRELRQVWRDEKRKSLEAQLPDITDGLIALAERTKMVEEKRKREQEEYAIAERKREAENRARLAELARVEKLKSDAGAWRQSQQIRAYVEAARRKEARKSNTIQPGSEFAGWVEWALREADRLDPLSDVGSNENQASV